MIRAAEVAGFDLDITCVDPYPTGYLQRLAHQGRITLLAEPAQDVALQTFTELQAGDLLFVDSTHTVKPGSEVNRLILEVFPRLVTGVTVHVHDVTWPYDHPRGILDEALFFWNESTLLHAFLVNNVRFTVRACLSQLHYERPDQLRQLVPWYRPQANDDGMSSHSRPGEHFPSSVYLQAL